MDGGCFKNEGSVFNRAAFGSSKILLHFCSDALGVHMGIPHDQIRQQQLKIKKPQHIVLGLCYLNLAISNMDVVYVRQRGKCKHKKTPVE